MERKHEVFVHGREKRRFGDRDSSRQREHRQRSKEQQIEKQRFLQRERLSRHHLQIHESRSDGPNTFDLEGDFTIRGVTKTEKLTLTDNGKGSTSGSIEGTMAFDRKDYGMNKGIPFIKIADRAEVNVGFKANQVSGPRLVYQQ